MPRRSAIVAPPVVGASVVARANALPGRPVDAVAMATADEAIDSVRSGRSIAAIVVDLRQETDRVYLASVNGAELNRVVLARITAVEASYGRRVETTDLVPARGGDVGHRLTYALAGLCVLAGLGVAMVITWRRGPRAATLGGGSRRLAVSAAAAAVVGGVIAVLAAGYYDTGGAAWWLVAALTILAGATTTLALESLFGVVGIGVAMTVLVLRRPRSSRGRPAAAARAVGDDHPVAAPRCGARAGTSRPTFGGDQIVRPVGVLVVWRRSSILTTVVARRERRRDLSATG